jgi:hypothetical protein
MIRLLKWTGAPWRAIALISQPPGDVLSRARSELVALGYAINEERGTSPVIDSLGSGELRGERAAGLDMDTRGRLFEVITVSARNDFASGLTRVEVRGGMESYTNAGIWQRVPSTRQVREAAEALLRKLTGTN